MKAGFKPEERAALVQAVDRWNAVAIEQYCLEDGDANSNVIFPLQYGGEEWKALVEKHNGENVIGIYYEGNGNISIVDVLSPEVFEVTALHELGHAHGLSHTPAPSIMHATVGTAWDFTTIDIDECVRVGACSFGVRQGE